MTESKEVALIEEITEEKAPAIYGNNKLDGYYEAVKNQVAGEVPDLKTAKGRKRVASLAGKVSSSKTAVEKPGREYLKRLKGLPKTIEKELREFVDKMDALRDEVRKPLTDYENAENSRKAAHEEAIWDIEKLTGPEDYVMSGLSSAEIKENLAKVEAVKLGDHWEEFEAKAARTKEVAIDRLKILIASAEKREAEQAELERLRKEQAEREEKERQERIREEAREAERKAAEQRAEEERQRVEREREAERQAAAEKERQHQLEIERANREKAEAEARALREKEAAEQRQREAVEAERRRIDEERAKAEAEAEKKAANRAHRQKINREALEDLQKFGIAGDEAKALIESIVRGEIRNITVNY